MIDEYEYLGRRLCWYCSKDDPSYQGFELRNGELACYDCRERIDNDEQGVIRTVSAYRAGNSDLSDPAFQLHMDVRQFKDRDDRDWLIGRLARALDEALERLVREEEPALADITAVPLPGTSPDRNHVARILAHLNRNRRPLPIAPNLLSVAEREQMHDTGANRNERQTLATQDDYQVDDPVPDGPIVLVDDMYVTGSTMNAAGRVLSAHGATGPIYGAVVSRMIHPDFSGVDTTGSGFRMFDWSYQPLDGAVAPPTDASRVRVRSRIVCTGCPDTLTSEPFYLDEGDTSTLRVQCPQCETEIVLEGEWADAGIAVDADGLRQNEIVLDLLPEDE